eukprot:4640825-Pleurochrysis_carterae.AAC.3
MTYTWQMQPTKSSEHARAQIRARAQCPRLPFSRTFLGQGATLRLLAVHPAASLPRSPVSPQTSLPLVKGAAPAKRAVP